MTSRPDMINSGKGRMATLDEAAAYCNVSIRTIRRMIARGTITGYRFGPRLVRISLDDIDAALSIIPAKS